MACALHYLACTLRAFKHEEANSHGVLVEKRRDAYDAEISYFIGSRRFRDGYELRDVSFKGLRAEEALPPLEEIQRFNQVNHTGIAYSPFTQLYDWNVWGQGAGDEWGGRSSMGRTGFDLRACGFLRLCHPLEDAGQLKRVVPAGKASIGKLLKRIAGGWRGMLAQALSSQKGRADAF